MFGSLSWVPVRGLGRRLRTLVLFVAFGCRTNSTGATAPTSQRKDVTASIASPSTPAADATTAEAAPDTVRRQLPSSTTAVSRWLGTVRDLAPHVDIPVFVYNLDDDTQNLLCPLDARTNVQSWHRLIKVQGAMAPLCIAREAQVECVVVKGISIYVFVFNDSGSLESVIVGDRVMAYQRKEQISEALGRARDLAVQARNSRQTMNCPTDSSQPRPN